MAKPRLDSMALGESVGKGCCGEVFSVTGSEQPLLVKQFNSMSVDRRFLERNFRRWNEMSPNEGIVHLYDHRVDSTPYAALFERVEGETLSSISGVKEKDAWKILRDLIEILGHAHKFGLVHGHLCPENVLLRGNAEKGKSEILQPVVTDFGTGLIGEIHHIDLGESAYFLAPEQIESGGVEWREGNAEKWDVYSFGVLAFWLINERLPRGLSYLKDRDRELAQSGGRPVPVDPAAFLEEVYDSPEISWGMSFGKNREHTLFREIIEECLSLDPQTRPVDMREVRNRFRALDHQFALEHAEDRVLKERRKQKGKLLGARALATCLGLSFFLASFFLIGYLKKTYFFQNKVSELDQVVLTQKATIDHLDERWSETVTDLKKSREAADSFFQKMARGDSAGGSGVASLKREDLEKSRDYYLKTLKDVEKGDETALERARALHSLAHIEQKLGLEERAISHFEAAIGEFEELLGRGVDNEEVISDVQMRLADSFESIGALYENPIGEEALSALQRATEYFERSLLMKPNDQEVIMRQAGTSFMLGHALDAHRKYSEAIAAYSRSAELASNLLETSPDTSEQLIELVGKLQFRVASSLKNNGRIDEAIDAHIASMETIERLRHVNGFTPLQSIQLASSFLELGELFETKEAPDADLDQLYNESLRLLTPLNTENPGDVEVAVLLCRSLVHLGQLEREEGRWTAGYRLSVRGIETLEEALKAEPDHVEGLLMIADARLSHLQFLEDEQEISMKIATKGLECIEQAKAALDSVDSSSRKKVDWVYEPIRSQMNERLGEKFRLYGAVYRELGDSDNAKRCLDQASIRVALRNQEEVIQPQ